MIKHVDERFARLSALAESTPQLVNGIVRDVSKRADASWVEMMGTIRAERMALSTSVSAERQAAVEAVDKERAAVAADATRLANQIISNAGEEARRLVRETLDADHRIGGRRARLAVRRRLLCRPCAAPPLILPLGFIVLELTIQRCCPNT